MTEHQDAPASDSRALRIVPVDADRWADLERLFEGRGGPHYCWCMAWRPMPSKQRGDKAAKKAQLQKCVRVGVPIGLLGYVGDRPVAWCSVGPRESFRRLVDDDGADGERVWSIVCFFIRRPHRGQGFTAQLIAAAVDYARAQGADVVEATPAERGATSYRFMGTVDNFAAAGFVNAGRAGARRHAMRRRL